MRNIARRASSIVAAGLVAASVLVAPSQSLANGWEPLLWKKDALPSCTDDRVEKLVLDKFNWSERHTWQRGFTLETLYKRHEHRTVRWKDSPNLRRYCMATGRMSDGRKRSVYYLIEEDNGFAGTKWGVSYCVSGLDPWHYKGGWCRTVR